MCMYVHKCMFLCVQHSELENTNIANLRIPGNATEFQEILDSMPGKNILSCGNTGAALYPMDGESGKMLNNELERKQKLSISYLIYRIL